MAKKRKKTKKGLVVSFRSDESLARRLERHAVRLRNAQAGSSWSRSSAALNLVLLALDQVESGTGKGYRLEVRTADAEAPWSRLDTEFTREEAKEFAYGILVPGMVYRVMRASDNKVFGGGVISERKEAKA
jgi:hypothetical protein